MQLAIVDLYHVPSLWIYTIRISDHVHHAVHNGIVVVNGG